MQSALLHPNIMCHDRHVGVQACIDSTGKDSKLRKEGKKQTSEEGLAATYMKELCVVGSRSIDKENGAMLLIRLCLVIRPMSHG